MVQRVTVGMELGHYVNTPVDEGRNSLEKRKNSGGSKVYRVVGVSFGLLCIIHSALNVSLRLQGIGFCNSTLLLEKNQLAEESGKLQANNNNLTRDNEMLNNQLSQQQDQIMNLQAEIEKLIMRLSEKELKIPSCPRGWTLYMSSCYYLSTEVKNWRNANIDCVTKGAYLVILNDVMEEDALRTFGSSVAWIGLRQKGLLKTWTWVDGSQPTNADRIKLPPDGQRFYCAYTEQIRSGIVNWVPANCAEQRYWVCEKKLNTTSITPE